MTPLSAKSHGPVAKSARLIVPNTPHRKLLAVEKERKRIARCPEASVAALGRSRNGDERDRWSAGARWDIVCDGARRGEGRSRGLDCKIEGKVTRQIDRKLPLSEEMADQALIGRITPRLGGIVATL
jgi:hypothetical protein